MLHHVCLMNSDNQHPNSLSKEVKSKLRRVHSAFQTMLSDGPKTPHLFNSSHAPCCTAPETNLNLQNVEQTEQCADAIFERSPSKATTWLLTQCRHSTFNERPKLRLAGGQSLLTPLPCFYIPFAILHAVLPYAMPNPLSQAQANASLAAVWAFCT